MDELRRLRIICGEAINPGFGFHPNFEHLKQLSATFTYGLMRGLSGGKIVGTFDALCVSYYRSPEFRDLKPSTQAMRRNIIEKYRLADIGRRWMRFCKQPSCVRDLSRPTPALRRRSRGGEGWGTRLGACIPKRR